MKCPMSFYSTLAGISMGFLALVSVFLFHRIGSIKNLLLGQGDAILQKQQQYSVDEKSSEGLVKMEEKHLRRLNDALCRKNIYGVYEAIYIMAIEERRNGVNLYLKKGFDNHILPKFKTTICCLRVTMFVGVIYIILFSAITLTPFLHCWFGFSWSPHLLSIIFIVVVCTFLVTSACITFIKVGFEKEKFLEVRSLKKEHKEQKKTVL